MRSVRSFTDAEAVIREINTFLDYLRTKSLDFNGRRIKNASPSEDDYDYTVRKEIPALIAKYVKDNNLMTRQEIVNLINSILDERLP
jgi:hypothetical protein